MDILKMLSDLRNERGQLEAAINVFERLVTGQRKRRGRPPKWMSQAQGRPRTKTQPTNKRKVSTALKRSATAKKADSRS